MVPGFMFQEEMSCKIGFLGTAYIAHPYPGLLPEGEGITLVYTTARTLSPLPTGERVRVRGSKKWPGKPSQFHCIYIIFIFSISFR
jgi:hypothetical protein